MTEQQLNSTEVRAVFQQVRCKAVATIPGPE
jgi:hypothetical protein